VQGRKKGQEVVRATAAEQNRNQNRIRYRYRRRQRKRNSSSSSKDTFRAWPRYTHSAKEFWVLPP